MGSHLVLRSLLALLLALSLAAPPATSRRQLIRRQSPDPPSPLPSPPSHRAQLPVIFLHGVLSNAQSGYRFAANLTADGRVFVPLAFCDDRCSVQALGVQVQLAIAQIREVVESDPDAFADGYVLVGHSQGGAIARAVVEEMDDHRVRTLVSLAGVVNGVFYGPQPQDANAALVFVRALGPSMVPPSVWDTSKYSAQDLNGTYQYDFELFTRTHPELQTRYSAFNLARSPVPDASWLATNTFLAELNNLNECAARAECERDQRRRRDNFLRLDAAHFFASPDDGIVAPWQSSILGRYSELERVEELKTRFSTMRVVGVKETREYLDDTFGLRSLDERGGLFLHTVAGVPHTCWVTDSAPFGSVHPCFFDDIYAQHIYSTLLD